jgi:ribosome-associated protein
MASPEQSSSTSSAAPSTRRTPPNAPHVLATRAVDAMADKKASDITVLDLRGISGMADFFVIATGGSERQVRAIANGVMDDIEEQCDERPWKREGMDNLQWVLLDYVDVVVHVFTAGRREYYDIERLWGEADTETVPENGDASDVGLLQQLSGGDAGD